MKFLALCLALAGAALAQTQRPFLGVILIGPPGSGKTVQAKAVSKKYRIPTVSIQELVKADIGKKSSLGKALAAVIESGELVSGPEATALINARLLRPDAGKGFVLDGYPASPEQARALVQFCSEHNYPKPVVIVLEAPDEELRSRLEMRHKPNDDNETIERRIREYRDLGRKAAEWFGPERVTEINAAAPVSTVTAGIVEAIEDADMVTGFKTRPTPAGRN